MSLQIYRFFYKNVFDGAQFKDNMLAKEHDGGLNTTFSVQVIIVLTIYFRKQGTPLYIKYILRC